MRIAYNNLVDATAVTLTASTADSNYPVANIQDQRLTTRWRTTAITAQSVIVDLGSAQAVDTAAILGHTISSVATVTLVGNTNATVWSAWAQTGSALAIVASVGAALATLTSTRVAYIDAQTEQLQAYSWSTSVWSTLGSALTITGTGMPALTGLTASSVAFIDGSNNLLSTYNFSGSVWSLLGSTLSISCSVPTIAAFTASSLAFMDRNSLTVAAYNWSGSTWSMLGSALAVSQNFTPSITALSTSVIAVADNAPNFLTTYSWSGSVWSAIGSALTATAFTPSIAALSSVQVAVSNLTDNTLRGYQWSGSAWSAIGSALTVTVLSTARPALAALNSSDVAWVDIDRDELRTYRSNLSLTSAETITYNANTMLKFFTSTSRRYWKLAIDGTVSGTYIEVGRVWLGSYLTVSPSSLVDFTVTKKRSDTVVYGKHRQKFASPGVGWRRFLLSFPESSATMVTAIETMYDTVGNHTSIIFCNFDTVRDWNIVEPCYCSIVGDVAFVNKGRYEATYNLELEEDR